MNKEKDDFTRRLLSTFKTEAREHINTISFGLFELEKSPSDEKCREIVETIFRETHSLKGAARAVNLTSMEALCQSMESVFAALKRNEISRSSALFNLLYDCVDNLDKLLLSMDAERPPVQSARTSGLIHHLESALRHSLELPQEEDSREIKEEPRDSPEPSQPAAERKPMFAETVRIPTAKLVSILLQVEELRSAKLAAGQRATELREINATLANWSKEWLRVQSDVRKDKQQTKKSKNRNARENGRSLEGKVLEFLARNYDSIKSLESKCTVLSKSAEQDQRSLGVKVDGLLEDIKKVLMLPISALLEIFPKLVHTVARDRGKEVTLVIRGSEVEVDRRILEDLKDPLIHLVRNCIDHGVEKLEQRERNQKRRRATITIAISRKSDNKAEILISDDGQGIDPAKIRATAVKLGLLPQEKADKLSEEETLSFIFESGFSTCPIITDISGRGLGLAIVREKVENLGGTISVETEPGTGTTFRMTFPLTLATSRGLTVKVDEHLFVLPTLNIERVARVNGHAIRTIENRETILIDGQAVSLVRLGDVLELPRKMNFSEAAKGGQTVVLTSGEKRIAFLVDEILNEQDVLVKTLGKHLSNVRNIAGATILGSGKAIPILNAQDLMKSAVRAGEANQRDPATPGKKDPAEKKSVLVAEDSITARMLLKNILEAAGYDVKTAIDGVDAFTQLSTGDFDIVISDVEMPRMSGFELTSKIRADSNLSDLPVVLVTALESQADRERGVEVGANGYIVKSSFDQSNLLDVIRRLI